MLHAKTAGGSQTKGEVMVPEVAVILPCRAADHLLGPQLQALARQQGAPSYKVILSDNGRNRDLAGLARRLAPELHVRIVDATQRAGTGFARNVGIVHAHSEKLLFCDADDVVGPTWVRDGAAMLDEVEAFCGGAVPFTAEELDASVDDVWAALARRMTAYVERSLADLVQGYPILLGCSFGMRRAFAYDLGGFDRAYGSQAEDNDLAFRIQETLGSMPVAPHVAVAYRVRPRNEASLRRSFRSGAMHARLCAQHDAWAVSPAYAGRWVLRPLREGLLMRHPVRPRRESLARLVGMSLGRVLYTNARPPKRLLGADESLEPEPVSTLRMAIDAPSTGPSPVSSSRPTPIDEAQRVRSPRLTA